MKKLSSTMRHYFGCKAQNGVVQPTGILAKAMVVSAREEASKIESKS
jgi:hypothetical protein